MRDPRYDILFEPVQIGPVTRTNRFFQVPHCNGMGYRDPARRPTMRRVKAEGGWAVVCTEQVEIHPTSDITPVHRAAALGRPGHPGAGADRGRDPRAAARWPASSWPQRPERPNLYSRETPLGPQHLPVATLRLRPGAGAGDDQGRHRRPAPLAPRGGPPLAAGRLRHRLRLCRARLRRHRTTSCRRATTTAPTSTAAASRTGCGCCARSSRTPAKSATARPPWPAGSRSTSCSATRASAAARSRTSSACSASCPTCGTSCSAAGRTTRSPPASGPRPSRSRTSRGLKQLTTQAGGRRRPVHLARHDGAPGQAAASST